MISETIIGDTPIFHFDGYGRKGTSFAKNAPFSGFCNSFQPLQPGRVAVSGERVCQHRATGEGGLAAQRLMEGNFSKEIQKSQHMLR